MDAGPQLSLSCPSQEPVTTANCLPSDKYLAHRWQVAKTSASNPSHVHIQKICSICHSPISPTRSLLACAAQRWTELTLSCDSIGKLTTAQLKREASRLEKMLSDTVLAAEGSALHQVITVNLTEVKNRELQPPPTFRERSAKQAREATEHTCWLGAISSHRPFDPRTNTGY